MYILTYLSADQFCIDILMRLFFFFQNSESWVTQNILAFCTKYKQTFRVIDETEFQIKEDEEAIFIKDYGDLIFH